MTTATVFAAGLQFPECPRWHDGQLHISDMWAGQVLRFDDAGEATVVWQAPREPVAGEDEAEEVGGTGWLPDGRLLAVGMIGRCLYRIDPEGPVVVADLSPFAPGRCNDMIVSPEGVAYISQIGFPIYTPGAKPVVSALMRVDPDGTASIAAEDLMVPNGIALSDDGRTMVVAESFAGRLSSYVVDASGGLSQRETFATIAPAPGERHSIADGICLDAAGAAWVADPRGRRVLRVERGGVVTHDIAFDAHPLAVVLGGSDRRTLFVCLSSVLGRANATGPSGRIEVLPAEVPGAGRP